MKWIPNFSKNKDTKLLSTKRILKIQEKIKKETTIRHHADIRTTNDIYIYQGVLPSSSNDEIDKDVLVKVLLSKENRLIRQFEKESKIYSHFRHDHLIRKEFSRTLNLGRPFGRARCIVLEYIDGIDLAQLIDYCAVSNTSVAQSVSIGIVLSVLKALHEVHYLQDRQGKSFQIIHSDLSPHNILLSKKGQVKLIDFGVSKVSGVNSNKDDLVVAGKLSHMAPEQIIGDETDARTDLYSLGIVLIELLLGRRFRAVDLSEVKLKHEILQGEQSKLNVGLFNKSLLEILSKSISLDPVGRFGTALDMMQALEEYLECQNIHYKSFELVRVVGKVTSLCGSDRTRQIEGLTFDECTDVSDNGEKRPKYLRGFFLGFVKAIKKWHIALPYKVGIGLAILCVVLFNIYVKTKVQKAKAVELTKQIQRNPLMLRHDEVEKFDEKVLDKNFEVRNVKIPKKTKQQENQKRPSSVKKNAAQKVGFSKLKKTVLDSKKIKKFGNLFVGASPWAEVTISKYVTNRSAPFSLKLPQGKHHIKARFQDDNGKWHYLSRMTTIVESKKSKCLVFFEPVKRVTCE